MFLLVVSTLLSFLFGFICPPLWILTFLSVRGIIRHGRREHMLAYHLEQAQRTQAYASWSR